MTVDANSAIGFVIRLDGDIVYAGQTRTILAAADPTSESITIIKRITANQDLTFHLNNVTGSNNVMAENGTTVSIWEAP